MNSVKYADAVLLLEANLPFMKSGVKKRDPKAVRKHIETLKKAEAMMEAALIEEEPKE